MADCSFFAQKWLMSDFGCDTAFLPKNLSIFSAHTLICPKQYDLLCFLSLHFVEFPGVKTKKPVTWTGVDTKMVAGPRIELGTRGFSVPCSTD